jgi:hypothetical protein
MIAAARFIMITSILFSVSIVFAAAPLESDPVFSGFLGDAAVYKKLTAGPEGGAKLRWIKPGANFKKYNKFMVDNVIFYLAGDSENKGIDPELMKEMADSFNKELVAAFKDKYPIVADPGPDVARIRIAITNIKQNRPGISAVTSVLPIGIGISLVKKGATGGWSGGGETGVELMAVDSKTNDVLVMGVDQQQAAFASRFSKYGSAKDAFKFWAERIVLFIDDTKGIKREPKE